jgi:hypothetical protein
MVLELIAREIQLFFLWLNYYHGNYSEDGVPEKIEQSHVAIEVAP